MLKSLRLNDIGAWILRNQEVILLVVTLFLFKSKSLYNISFGLMAILGLYRLIRLPRFLFQQPETRFYCLLFFSIWIPMLIGFIDPVNLERCASTVWPYLRYFLGGAYVLIGLRGKNFRSQLETVFFIIVTFWSLDALLQFLTGRDILGYPYVKGIYITGIFYPELTVSHVLAGFSALYFESLRRRSEGRPWVWLLAIPLFMVVFLAGRRSIWFMLGVNAFAYIGYRFYRAESRKQFLRRGILAGLALIAVLGALYVTQDSIQHRVHKTMGLFSTDIEQIDKATSRRVDAWRTAWRMYEDHWINGIGPRGFRYVYQEYADKDFNFYKTSVTHPHMVILEIMAESGTIGLLGYLLFLYLLFSTARRYARYDSCYAGFIAVFAATVPINSHVAFYGSYWSSILWWIIIYLVVNMYEVEKRQPVES